jgi:hypothetical protein
MNLKMNKAFLTTISLVDMRDFEELYFQHLTFSFQLLKLLM